MKPPGGIATGIVVALLGVWLVLRTVTHDDNGQNLPDKILGLGGDSGGDAAPEPLDPAAAKTASAAIGATAAAGAQGARHAASGAKKALHPNRKHARAA